MDQQPHEPRESNQAPRARRQVGSRPRNWRLALGLGFVVLGGVAAMLLTSLPPADSRPGPILTAGRVSSRIEGVSLEHIIVDTELSTYPLNPYGLRMRAITDAQGFFQTEGAISGTGYVWVARKSTDPWTCRPLPNLTLPAREPLEIEMIEGVAVTGRLVRAGAPEAGAMVRMSLTKLTSCPRIFSYHEGETDKQGRFTFRHAFEDCGYMVYTTIGAPRGGGLIEPRFLRTAKDGTVVDLGDLEIRPGRTLAGRIVNGDGRPLDHAMGVSVWLEWPLARLGNVVSKADKNGTFVCTGLPELVVMVSPYDDETTRNRRPGDPPPYWLSPRCSSLDPRDSSRLIGRLDRDVLDLIIELSPSETPPPSDAAETMKRLEEARSRTIQGAPAGNAPPRRGPGS